MMCIILMHVQRAQQAGLYGQIVRCFKITTKKKKMEYNYSELKVPIIDPGIPNLDAVFKHIQNNHKQRATYSFSSEAQSYFITVHDELCDLYY